jgi:hypothetical protein
MEDTKQIHIFISHSWQYSEHYEKIESWIFKEKWAAKSISLNFKNYSVPKDNPIHNAENDRQLQKAIYQQIALSHVIIIPTGMYSSHSKWIKKEIDGAKKYKKPILAVNPWGQIKKSSIVQDAADKSVGWNKESVVEATFDLFNKIK